MMKRIVAAVIAMTLLFSFSPLFAVGVSAASDMKASEEIVEMIQAIEGFQAIPYWDYAQWTVGFGTECPDEDLERYRAEGIPVAEAQALFAQHMGRHERAVDKFMDKYGLTLSQQQYDALISYTYNFGPASLSKDSYTIVQAISSGATGNDLIYAFSIYCMAGGEFQPGLMRRRLAEANLWFTGVYDDYPPESYCYIRYDANGGVRDASAQGYNSDLAAVPLSRPTREGYTFMGWFTEPEGGEQITELNVTHHGMMLYAHWEAGEVAVEFPAAPKGGINVRVTGDYVNIRSGPGTGYEIVASVTAGQILTITETMEAKGNLWGKCSQGWICLDYTNYSEIGKQNEDEPPKRTDVQLPAYISVVSTVGIQFYNGPHTTYPQLGSLSEGEVVMVEEYTVFAGNEWLRYEGGWIRLNDKILIHDEHKLAHNFAITSTATLAIREKAGVNNTKITNLKKGSTVMVYAFTYVDGEPWGRIPKGWINLTYTDFDETLLQQYQNHSFGQWYATGDSTCAGPGTERRDCQICGYSETREVEAVAHSYGDWQVIQQPTCTADGQQQRSCTQCGYIETSAIEPIGHDFGAWHESKEPTAEEAGEERRNCRVCGYQEVREVGLNEHSFGQWYAIREATCVDEGLQRRDCQDCGHYQEKIVEALGHNYSDWYETIAPTVEEYGQERRDCQRCEDYQTRQIDKLPPPPIIHTFAVVTCDVLRIRTGPGTEHSQVGLLSTGDRVEILEIQTVDGIEWGRIEEGWICLTDFVTLETVIECVAPHTYGEWYVTQEAACAEVGQRRRDCSVCGTYETEEIAATGHDYASAVTEPTCTEEGYTSHTCTKCGDSYNTDPVTAIGHHYNKGITGPTCTEEGYTTYTCTRCGDSYRSDVVAALGHSYDAVTIEPTCTEYGYTTYTCGRCTDTYTGDTVAALGHRYDAVTTEPTCTETGYTTYTCHCGDTYTEEIAPLGHSYGDWYETLAPTMDEYGQERRDCAICGCYETRQTDKIPVPKVERTYATVICDVLRVRTGPGTEHSQVGVLHTGDRVEILEIQTVDGIEWGRTEDGWICLTDLVTLETVAECAIPHTYGEWYVTREATCEENGQRRRDCGRCGACETEVIAASGHAYSTAVTDPTCTEDGYTTYTCGSCGDSYRADIVAALGHRYDVVSTEPTCTQAGCATYTCHCGHAYSEEIAALGHSYGDWYETLSPTYDDYGQERRDCARCGHFETRQTDKLPVPTVKRIYATVTCDVLRVRSGPGMEYSQVRVLRNGDRVEILEIQTVDGNEWGRMKDGWICLTGYTTIEIVEEEIHVTHTYGEWYVETEPTCTESGQRRRDCEACDHSETETIEATGHSYVDGKCEHCGAPKVLLGDVNGDGKVNARDARLLLRYCAYLIGADEIDLISADYNGDGNVNARDARLLLRIAANLA